MCFDFIIVVNVFDLVYLPILSRTRDWQLISLVRNLKYEFILRDAKGTLKEIFSLIKIEEFIQIEIWEQEI